MNLTRLTLATASSVLLVATLAACGGNDDGGNEATDGGPQLQQGGPGGPGFPGATGTVAAVDGSTAQVQNPQSGQVAVTWTGDTTFTQEVDGSLDDVAVGGCVMVESDDAGTDPDATEFAAATVRITEPNDDGGCGPGGPGGDRPEGAPSDRPSDFSEGAPDGAPDGTQVRGFGRVGEVTAVTADGFTLSTTTPGSDEPSELTVTVDGDTAYTTTAPAEASAVKVGRCVTARGDSDDTGAVEATSIAVSEPVDGQCGGFFRSAGGPGGAA